MKKLYALFFIALITINFTACSDNKSVQNITENSIFVSDMEHIYISENKGAELMRINEYDEKPSLEITVGGKKFSAVLYENETASALVENLPLTMDMHELNGNEKYYNLPFSLPTNTEPAEQINAGDIMLYGDNCIVLFYKSFNTSYSYTKLGYITDAELFAQSVGNSNVTVDISKADNNSEINTEDLKVLKNFILNNTSVSDKCDVNRNNAVNCLDTVLMKNKFMYPED